MRIRKQASKLLGWAYHSQFPSSSSPPLSASQYSWPPSSEADAGELQCQLNLSPWDAIESPHCTISQEDFEIANEEEEEEMGVVGNSFKAKEEEEEEKVEDKKGQARKNREKETEAGGVMKCKKTDGKRWHCKRAAQLPHSLCSYHLTQLRSYRTRIENQVVSGVNDGDRSNRRKKSASAVDAVGAASNYYYYYSILGPWWGKRRGPIDGNEGGSTVGNESSESNDESEISPKDGEHDEALGDDDQDGGGSRCNVNYTKKKKRPHKKRGRKPVKARSLKSLL